MEADILSVLLRMTIAISVAVIAVLILRHPVRSWLGARNAYALWMIVPLSAAAILAPARRIVEALPNNTHSTMMAAPAVSAPAAIHDFNAVATPAAPLLIYDAISWEPVLFVAWAVGLAGALALLVWRQQRFLARLGALERSFCDGVEVYKARAADIGPALVGALAPRLVVPADFDQRFNAKERALVIAHEHVHLSRRDVQINGLAAVLGCIFWFNPLFAFAIVRMREDQEMACDATVLARESAGRGDYARALLKTQFSSGDIPIGCAWPSAGSHPLKTRMTALAQNKPNRLRERTGAIAIACVALISGAAAWSMQPPIVSSVAFDEAATTVSAASSASITVSSNVASSPRTKEAGSSASYIDRLASAGLVDLTADELIALKIHNVDVTAIKSAQQLGFDPTPDNLVAMSVANVTPEFAAEVRAEGWNNVSIEELISMRHMDVDPADGKKFIALGLQQMTVQQLISFAAMGVTVDYVRSLQGEGITEKDPDGYARAAAMGITPDFIAEARRRGFDELTLDKLVRMKSADIF